MTGLTDSLPLAHPRVFGRHDGDHSTRNCVKNLFSTVSFSDLPVKVVGGNVHDAVLVLLHPQERFTVVAAIVFKLFDGLK